MKQVKNEYVLRKERTQKRQKFKGELMLQDAKNYDLVIYDDVDQNMLNFYDKKNIIVIILYASLNTLVDNIYSRKNFDARETFVFTQFANRYVKSDENNAIDKISKQNFINKLKEKLKYDFESEEALIKFADEIFNKMEIYDDDYNFIKIRDEFVYDYIIVTDNKTPEEIFEEIKKKLNL